MKKEIKNYLNKTKNIKVKNKGIIKLKTDTYKHVKLPSLNESFMLKVSKGIKVKKPLRGIKQTYNRKIKGNLVIKSDGIFYEGQEVICFCYNKSKNGKITRNFIEGKISYLSQNLNEMTLTVIDNKFGLKHIVWKKDVVSKEIMDEIYEKYI